MPSNWPPSTKLMIVLDCTRWWHFKKGSLTCVCCPHLLFMCFMGEEDEGIINHCMVDVANIDESSR